MKYFVILIIAGCFLFIITNPFKNKDIPKNAVVATPVTSVDSSAIIFQKVLVWAQNGNASYQYWVGYGYYYGLDVAKDYKSAFYWFTKSATQGDVNGEYWLGIMY